MIWLLSGLVVKHFFFDYPFQTLTEVKHKGTYGNLKGMMHSFKHGVGTFIVLLFFVTPSWALLFGLYDFVTHYHVDWLKVRLTNRVEYLGKTWWLLFGLDQMTHMFVYISILFTVANMLNWTV